MELPPSFTSSTSFLKRLPAQTSHGTNTLARNTISTSTCPAPSHASHRPPATLNENVLGVRSEEHTSELQSLTKLVCRLLLEKKKLPMIFAIASIAPATTH